tara:strand:- start:126 stop:452 length:327 start_codon:yes stop_codon:yes gene_type:complete
MKELDKDVYIKNLEKKVDELSKKNKELEAYFSQVLPHYEEQKQSFSDLVWTMDMQPDRAKFPALIRKLLDDSIGVVVKGEHIQDSPFDFINQKGGGLTSESSDADSDD